MSGKARIAILASDIALGIAIALLTFFLMDDWGVLINVAFYVAAGVGAVAGITAFFIKKIAILKTALVLLIVAAVILAAFILVGKTFRLDRYETDGEKIDAFKKIIESTGGWGMLVFVTVQILQVVILPLPAVVCYVPGAMIWGAPTATLLASAGVIAGSVIDYFIGKIWGKKAVVWIAGKETVDKYSPYFGKRGKGIFVIMQILPFFPDDILCMISGLAGMNFAFFITTICIVRPAIIAAYCFLGSGNIIPFSGWGIYVWVAIAVVCVALAVISFLYQDKFESWLMKKFSKKKSAKAQGEDTEPAESGENGESGS